MAPSRLPLRSTRLLTYIGVAVFAGITLLWRYRAVHVNTSAPAQPTQNHDSSALSLAENLPPSELATASLNRLLRSSPTADPDTLREIEALAQNPNQAVIVGLRLMQEFPDRATELGTVLVGALVRASAHAAALELAQNGPEAQRAEWMTLVLSHWAQNRPADAVLITDLLREKGVARETFALVTKSWATSAPEPLARYALALPPGEYRSIAFRAALDPWIQQDPASVANCLPQLTEPAERDQVLSLLATRTDTATRTTSQAVTWAEAIANPDLRRTTLTAVVREWFGHDPAAANHYLLTNPTFDAEQRQSLLASLSPVPEAL